MKDFLITIICGFAFIGFIIAVFALIVYTIPYSVYLLLSAFAVLVAYVFGCLVREY